MLGMNRRKVVWVSLAVVLAIPLSPWPGLGQGGETAGVITEIKPGRGRVEVKAAGASEWRRAGPLMALRAGDTVRVSENASVVILLSGGRGSVKVDAASSPFVVPAPHAEAGKVQKARTLLAASLNFLSSEAKELPKAVLATRAGPRPPAILSPRNGPVLPGPLSFEWLGSRFSRYTLRILGPSGVVHEVKNLTGAKLDYPPTAPPLAPGTRYTFQVLAGSHPPQEAWFEVLDPQRAQAVQRELLVLEQELGPLVPPNTLVTARVGLLANRGLLHDARLALVAALAKDPDEPTLHQLLGNLYANAGLPELAAESYDEAQFLSTRGAGEPPPKR